MKGERRKNILISLKRKLLIKHNHLNYTEEKYESPPPSSRFATIFLKKIFVFFDFEKYDFKSKHFCKKLFNPSYV